MDGFAYLSASRLMTLPRGPAKSLGDEPPRWAAVRYDGMSPRPTALRIVADMQSPVLKRLGGFHPVQTSLTSIFVRFGAVVFDLRCAAEAARSGDARWSQQNAELMLRRVRHMRAAHSAAVRLARELAERPAR